MKNNIWPTHKIALYTPANSISVQAFNTAFMAHFSNKKTSECHFQHYYPGDEQILIKCLNEENVSLLISIDQPCTNISCKLLNTIPNHPPFIFNNLDEPHGWKKMKRTTGIVTPYTNYTNQMLHILSFIMPTKKKVLLLYDEYDQNMIDFQKQLVEKLRELELLVTVLPRQLNITRREIIHISSHDMIMLLTPHPTTQYFQRLSLLCRQHKSLLYASNPILSNYGAALSFGKDEKEIGKQAAIQALQLFEEKTVPPLATVPYKLCVNPQAMEHQGLALIKLLPFLSLLETTTLISPTIEEKVAAYLRLENIPLE